MKPMIAATLIAGMLLTLGACSGADKRQERTLGKMKVPLWVEVAECRKGRPHVEDYSVLKMPGEKVLWAFGYRDKACWMFGALMRKGDKRAPDDCDIRYRSKEPVKVKGKRCRCVVGLYDLVEGRSTSERCCKRNPDSIHCLEKATTPKTEN